MLGVVSDEQNQRNMCPLVHKFYVRVEPLDVCRLLLALWDLWPGPGRPPNVDVIGADRWAVSYTHLTLPTIRLV